MARIVYGVAGQGFGHSSRSHLTGSRLLADGHEVLFLASMKSLSYLTPLFPHRVKPVFGLSLIYSNGTLNTPRTLAANIMQAPKGLVKNHKLFKSEIKNFQPELVISDYEPFIAHWAKNNGVPCLTVDHQCTLTCLELDPVPNAGFSRMTAGCITRAYYPRIDNHIIINFFKAPTKGEGSTLVGPVLRREVIEKQPTQGEHIIFYTTDLTLRERGLDVFARFPERTFYFYGFDEDRRQGNCVFKKTSTEDFLADLASCAGVIATAGFSLISECLHFRKKSLLLPVKGQYEQMINAHYIEKSGAGLSAEELTEDAVRRFVETLESPWPDSDLLLYPDNEKFFSVLEAKIKELGR